MPASAMIHPLGGRSTGRVQWRFVVAVSLGVFSAMFLAPELFGVADVLPFAPFVALRPVAAVGLLVLAVVVVLVRRRWWLVALVVGMVAAVALGVVVPRAIAGPAPGPGRTLTLLSFNVYDGHADVSALARTIHTVRPDVVVLPEAGERYRQLLMPQVVDLGYRSWTTEPPDSEDVNGIVVLAAPWLGAVTAEPLFLDTKFRWMQVTGGGLGTVRVIAVHVAAPVPELTQGWISELGRLQQWCAPGRGSNVVIGDVNATLDHSVLRSGITGCTDVAADRGEGLVATWPSSWPRWFGVQIDHVFVAGRVRPGSVLVLDMPGSDHRALLTRVVVSWVCSAPRGGRASAQHRHLCI
jgi:endonuclease/exonuclease/phosphatase (EEP) superfamily protein YafD